MVNRMIRSVDRPLISIVVAVLNGARTLPTCLDSVFAQSHADWELIVIDGGSRDGTLEYLRTRAARFAYWVSEPDRGIYNAWNKAVPKARGEWLSFLGSDDRLHDAEVLRDLAEAAARTPHRIVYGRMDLITRAGKLAHTVGKPWPSARREFIAGFMFPHPGALHHRSLFAELGLFDESYRYAGDYEFLLRELLTQDAQFVDRVIVDMAVLGMTARPQTIHRVLREVLRARRAHGLADAPARLRLALATSWLGARIHGLLGERAFNVLADAYRLVRGRPRIWTA
jgi:glycosyltransferase involved in cell wall biosynthesis